MIERQPELSVRVGFTRNSLPPGTEIIVEGYRAKDGANRGVGANLTFTDAENCFSAGRPLGLIRTAPKDP